MLNTSLIPIGVKQSNEKKQREQKQAGDANLAALDEYLRKSTMASKEERLNGNILSGNTYRDTQFNNVDEKLGNFSNLVAQQNTLQNDVAAAMAANTIQKKTELWRIQELNDSISQVATQFGLVESAKRQWKQGKKVHKLSQQTTWFWKKMFNIKNKKK